MDKEIEKPTTKSFSVIGDANKSVPKFCTSVNFSRLKNGDIVMQFLHGSNGMENDEANNTAVLIESVIVDKSHAEKIAEVLKKVIETNET